jgi:hypothetical protein
MRDDTAWANSRFEYSRNYHVGAGVDRPVEFSENHHASPDVVFKRCPRVGTVREGSVLSPAVEPGWYLGTLSTCHPRTVRRLYYPVDSRSAIFGLITCRLS